MGILDTYNDFLYIHISEIFENNSKKEIYQYFYENTDKIVLIDNSDEPDFVFSNKDIIFWKEIDKLFPHNNCFLLTMGYDQNKFFEFKNIKIITFDLSHLYITSQIFDDISYESEFYVSHDMKFIKSLNRTPRPHRIVMVDELYRSGLLENNTITWNITTDQYYTSNRHTTLPKFKYWKEKLITIDDGYNRRKVFNDKSLYFDNKYFVNLVGETSHTNPVITEKTFGAILNKELFLSYGIPHINKKLQTMGFELYDDIFDYTFDSLDDTRDSCKHITKQLHNIKDKNLYNLKMMVKDKINFNHQLLKNKINDNKNIPYELRTIIDSFYTDLQNVKLGYTMRGVIERY